MIRQYKIVVNSPALPVCNITEVPTVGVSPTPIVGADGLYRFSVDQYHVMITRGIFDEGENVELLDGLIVPKTTRNPPHSTSVKLTDRRITSALPADWHTRVQDAVTLEHDEPEPDVVVVRGEVRDYAARHPESADIGALIEVADASLSFDRQVKAPLYARANVPVYWIVNIVNEQIEVYSRPSGQTAKPQYGSHDTYSRGESVPLVLDGVEVVQIAVDEFLP